MSKKIVTGPFISINFSAEDCAVYISSNNGPANRSQSLELCTELVKGISSMLEGNSHLRYVIKQTGRSLRPVLRYLFIFILYFYISGKSDYSKKVQT